MCNSHFWIYIIIYTRDFLELLTLIKSLSVGNVLEMFSMKQLFQIDRLYDWKKSPDSDVAATLKKQKKNTKDEFEERAKAIIVEFAQQVRNCPFIMKSLCHPEGFFFHPLSAIMSALANTAGSVPLMAVSVFHSFPLSFFLC